MRWWPSTPGVSRFTYLRVDRRFNDCEQRLLDRMTLMLIVFVCWISGVLAPAKTPPHRAAPVGIVGAASVLFLNCSPLFT